jgi:hypothetical protein
MKIVSLLFFLFMTFRLQSQVIYFPYEWDSGADYDVIYATGFDVESDMLFFDDDSLWQTGPPQKLLFDSAWSSPNVLITDTVQVYPDSTETYFYLKFKPWESNNIFIAWNQRVDVGEGDSCLVEMSSDGLSWMSLTEYFNYIQGVSFMLEIIYYKTDLLTGISESPLPGENFEFSDTTTGWTQQSLWFHYLLPVKESEALFTDSLFVRFRFVSDQNTENNEGWMIDDMYTGNFWISGSISEVNIFRQIQVFPNPAENAVSFDSDILMFPVEVIISDMNGKQVHSSVIYENTVQVQFLESGQYLFTLKDASGKSAYSFLQIQK